MKKILGIVIGILIVTAGFLWVNAQITGGVCDDKGNCSLPSKRNNPFSNFGKKQEPENIPELEFPKFTHSMYEEDVKNGKKKIYIIAFVKNDKSCEHCKAAKGEGELLDQLTQYYKNDSLVGVYVAYYKDTPMTNGRYVYSEYARKHPESCVAGGDAPVFAWLTANGNKQVTQFSEIACGYDRTKVAQSMADVIEVIEAVKKAAFPSGNSNNTRAIR
ncbi:hypothetical protein [Candidatus Avelusimicrobium luingense]|uniref:hypothetical protein n=1 Tax=Candidatus Avelusimicrobium luingense TaxID=3416211 RepID=UPI003D0E50D1